LIGEREEKKGIVGGREGVKKIGKRVFTIGKGKSG